MRPERPLWMDNFKSWGTSAQRPTSAAVLQRSSPPAATLTAAVAACHGVKMSHSESRLANPTTPCSPPPPRHPPITYPPKSVHSGAPARLASGANHPTPAMHLVQCDVRPDGLEPARGLTPEAARGSVDLPPRYQNQHADSMRVCVLPHLHATPTRASPPWQATCKGATPVVHLQRVAGGRSPTGDSSPSVARPVSAGSGGNSPPRPRGYQPRSLDMKPVALRGDSAPELAGQLVVTPTRML